MNDQLQLPLQPLSENLPSSTYSEFERDAPKYEAYESAIHFALKSVFEKFNVKEIDPVGERFDPHRHQAISTVQSDLEPNSVVQVLQKGYQLHERVLRPALVTVAKAVEN